MLALRSERFARIAKESSTTQKFQAVFFVAMLVNMAIKANITFSVFMSGGHSTNLLITASYPPTCINTLLSVVILWKIEKNFIELPLEV